MLDPFQPSFLLIKKVNRFPVIVEMMFTTLQKMKHSKSGKNSNNNKTLNIDL